MVLEPTDEIQKLIWMFNDQWLRFPEGFIYTEGLTEEEVIQPVYNTHILV